MIPSTGPVLGGTAVTVTGTGFVNSVSLFCKFGEQEVAGVFASATSVVCVSPQHIAGSVNLEVSSNRVDFSTSMKAFEFKGTGKAVSFSQL